MSYPPAGSRLPFHDDDRPVTAAPSSSSDHYFSHHVQQYTYSQEDPLDDDESEDEDVFAYLPPTTAEFDPPSLQHNHQQHLQQQQQQQQGQHALHDMHPLQTIDERPQTKHGDRPLSMAPSSPLVSPPPPVFDPTSPSASLRHSHTTSYPSTLPPQTPFSATLPLQIPYTPDSAVNPSSDLIANGIAGASDPRRFSRPGSTSPSLSLSPSPLPSHALVHDEYVPPSTGVSGAGGPAARLSLSRSGLGSRGVRVELPANIVDEDGDTEKLVDLEQGHARKRHPYHQKERPVSDNSIITSSMAPSVAEYTDAESRESIK